MAIGISELEASNPSALLQAGDRANAAAAEAGQQASSARQMVTTMRGGWKGIGSDAAAHKANDYIEQHESLRTVLQSAGSTLVEGGHGLAQSRIGILNYVAQLKSQGWQVADNGSVSVRPGSPLDLFAKLSPAGSMTLQLAALKASAELKVNLAKFSAQDQALAERLKTFRPKESPDEPDQPKPDEPKPDEPKPGEPDPKEKKWGKELTPEEKAEMARWSQFFATNGGDNGGGDCSRWATASALASKYGTRIGPNGKEIDLPPEVQKKLMNGMPLHFPPTKTEINQIARSQGVAAGNETRGFPGQPDKMSQQLSDMGIPSTSHMSNDASALVDQMTVDLNAGHSAIVNGAFPGSDGHFISVTGTTTGPNGETLYVVNDSNRVSDGSPNANTIPSPCTRSQLEKFLSDRKQYGMPGYSTV